ncbi:hypothetical protein [Mitsuaria sp. GD03876]|uniref:hypothetical protein n=1 Tax=Mitsuaria sp. GD03876 TaxID=2975399 RepID=UPI00244A3A86|nr:hypothetical protein [Mitsuaria sp. GD03876]MDH0864536.1 hypothetical protein [Mitsuaria sp. GD03876]
MKSSMACFLLGGGACFGFVVYCFRDDLSQAGILQNIPVLGILGLAGVYFFWRFLRVNARNIDEIASGRRPFDALMRLVFGRVFKFPRSK